MMRYPDDGVLHLTAAEWTEFLTAVKRGDFDGLTSSGGPPKASSHHEDAGFILPAM